MINIQIKHDLDNLLDIVNQMQNQIQMRISEAETASVAMIESEILSKYQTEENKITVDMQSDGFNYQILIENLDEDGIYAKYGETMDDVQQCISELILNNIGTTLSEGVF